MLRLLRGEGGRAAHRLYYYLGRSAPGRHARKKCRLRKPARGARNLMSPPLSKLLAATHYSVKAEKRSVKV